MGWRLVALMLITVVAGCVGVPKENRAEESELDKPLKTVESRESFMPQCGNARLVLRSLRTPVEEAESWLPDGRRCIW